MTNFKIYKLDSKTLDGILKNDREAINRFYFDNLEQLQKHAYKYAARKVWNDRHDYEADDLLTQIYIDIPLFNFKSDYDIFFSIKNSMWASIVGGLANLKKMRNERNFAKMIYLDAPISDEEDAAPFLDFLCSAPGVEDTLFENEFREESDKRAYDLLKKIYKGAQFKLAYEIVFNGRSYSAARRG